MAFSKLLNFGFLIVEASIASQISDAFGAAVQSDMTLRQQLAEDYPIHVELGAACQESKLNFQQQRGTKFYVSTTLARGSRDSRPMKCLSFIVPEAQLLKVQYVPDEAVFRGSDRGMRRLLNWVNSQLYVGRFHPFFRAEELGSTDLVRLGYQAAIPYEHGNKAQIKLLAASLFQYLVGFYDLFIPTVKALQAQRWSAESGVNPGTETTPLRNYVAFGKLPDQTVSIDENGQLRGPAAAEINRLQQSATQQLTNAFRHRTIGELQVGLQQWLNATGVTWEISPGTSWIRLKGLDEQDRDAWHYAYVTELAEVVFEARSRWTVEPSCRQAVIGSKYLLLLNHSWSHAGAYFLDLADNRMVVRAGISTPRLRGELPIAQLTRLAGIFVEMSLRLGDICRADPAFGLNQDKASGTQGRVARIGSYEETCSAVTAIMNAAKDPYLPLFEFKREEFDSEFGTALEDIA